MNKTRTTKLLTADQMTAKLARLAPAITRRATVRAAVATEMGLGVAHPAVVKEAHRRLRAA